MTPTHLYLYFDGHANRWRATTKPQIGRVVTWEVPEGQDLPHLYDAEGHLIPIEMEN